MMALNYIGLAIGLSFASIMLILAWHVWERVELDQRRAADLANIAANPALYTKLMDLESKIDHIFEFLVSLQRQPHSRQDDTRP